MGDDDRHPIAVPRSLVTASDIVWRTAVVVLGLLALAWLVLELRVVTVPAFMALLATTVLQPPVLALRRRGWRPLLATWTVLVAAVAVVAGVVALLLPGFLDQTDDLGASFDEGIAEIEDWLETGPVGLDDPDVRGAIDSGIDRVLDADPAALVDGVTLAAEIVGGSLLALVMLFFFVKDGPKLADWWRRQIPVGRRGAATRAAGAAWNALGAYVRGTLVVGIVNGAAIGIALAVLGVPLALPLAIVTAIAAFFPLVGAVVAGALAALVALVAGGVVEALIVIGVTVLVQQVEGDVLNPIVMGRALKLHPLVILVALTVGAISAGLLGAFMAVPLTAMTISAVSAARGDVPDAPPTAERSASEVEP